MRATENRAYGSTPLNIYENAPRRDRRVSQASGARQEARNAARITAPHAAARSSPLVGWPMPRRSSGAVQAHGKSVGQPLYVRDKLLQPVLTEPSRRTGDAHRRQDPS